MVTPQYRRGPFRRRFAAPGAKQADPVQRRKPQEVGFGRRQRHGSEPDAAQRGPARLGRRIAAGIPLGSGRRFPGPSATGAGRRRIAASLPDLFDPAGNVPYGPHSCKILQVQFDVEPAFQRVGDDRQTAGANGQVVAQIHVRFDFVAFVAGRLQNHIDDGFQNRRVSRNRRRFR